MVIFALAFILIIYFFVDNKNFIYALMVFFILFDMVDGFYKDVKIFAAIRYVIPFLLIMIFALTNKVFKKSDWVLLLYIIYLVVLMFFNVEDPVQSGKNVLALVIAFLMIPIGRFLGEKKNFLRDFEVFSRVMIVVIPIYVLYSNVFKIGESYTSSFYVGFYDTSRMYALAIVIFIRFQYVMGNRYSSFLLKIFDFSFIGLNLIILILTTRRTTLAILLASILVYTFFNREVAFKVIFVFGILIVTLMVTYPIYQTALEDQLEKRERIQNVDSYEEEKRYLESFYVWHHHKINQSPKELFFGVKLFDTEEFGDTYFGNGRPIHSDINMIIYSTGLFGFFLFLSFSIYYFGMGNFKMLGENKQLFYPFLTIFFIILIPGRFIGTFNIAPLIMLFLGASKHMKIENKGKVLNGIQKGENSYN